MSDMVLLHPGMTAQQIAEWCQKHGMFVRIDYTTDADGFCMPVLQARREVPLEQAPLLAFLRPQAE